MMQASPVWLRNNISIECFSNKNEGSRPKTIPTVCMCVCVFHLLARSGSYKYITVITAVYSIEQTNFFFLDSFLPMPQVLFFCLLSFSTVCSSECFFFGEVCCFLFSFVRRRKVKCHDQPLNHFV